MIYLHIVLIPVIKSIGRFQWYMQTDMITIRPNPLNCIKIDNLTFSVYQYSAATPLHIFIFFACCTSYHKIQMIKFWNIDIHHSRYWSNFSKNTTDVYILFAHYVYYNDINELQFWNSNIELYEYQRYLFKITSEINFEHNFYLKQQQKTFIWKLTLIISGIEVMDLQFWLIIVCCIRFLIRMMEWNCRLFKKKPSGVPILE